jgi:hypothetical protein
MTIPLDDESICRDDPARLAGRLMTSRDDPVNPPVGMKQNIHGDVAPPVIFLRFLPVLPCRL